MLNSKPTKKSDPAMAERLKLTLKGGPSQTAIAHACGVTDQAVTGWLKTGRISKAHLPTISKLCGVDLNWLITGVEPAPVGNASQSHQGIA
ncbi:MAG TPA: YdaS family helix-turn-helix protein, partial [Marinagarivorans sp.]|nr:YdaS family helix-turn-helix protein [Marinagarivorans sp.]